MIPSPTSLLVLAVLHGAPVVESAAACEDSLRLELASTPVAEAREICVSPGMMTGFLFDTSPSSMELQDEVRFVEVLQGRRGLSFVPPKDMMRGDRLRLTVRFDTGSTQEAIAFMLVAHPGQATRQVEVYRNTRPRESYQQEVEEERAENQKLRQENQRLRARLERARGLRNLITSGIMTDTGVTVLGFHADLEKPQDGPLVLIRYNTFRADQAIAAQVWLKNPSAEPWKTIRATFIAPNGDELSEIHVQQDDVMAPGNGSFVILEVNATTRDVRGEHEVRLWDEKSRVFSIHGVRFP